MLHEVLSFHKPRIPYARLMLTGRGVVFNAVLDRKAFVYEEGGGELGVPGRGA